MKTALGVPHKEWGVRTLCTVTNQFKGPQDMSGVYCSAQGTVVDFFLKQRFMRGVMHTDISKFIALSGPSTQASLSAPSCAHADHSPLPPYVPRHRDLSRNFLSGPLDPFITPLTGLTALKSMYHLHSHPALSLVSRSFSQSLFFAALLALFSPVSTHP
ncbi:unnamed protein product [Closterium sp. NIES-54]